MRYLLLINIAESDQASGTPEAAAEMSESYRVYTEWLQQQGFLRGGEKLAASTAATTVRVRDGHRLFTDGPFVETKEALGGFYLIECDDLDQALDAAARCPDAKTGVLEVRPIVEMAGTLAPQRAGAGTAG